MRALLLMIVYCLPAFAGTAAKSRAPAMVIQGASHFTRQEMSDLIGLPDGLPAPSGLLRAVDAYRAAGYLNAAASVGWNTDSSVVTISISEGPRFRTSQPVFHGNGFIAARYLSGLLAQKPGAFFDQQLLPADLQRISRAYAEAGFPHAVVRLAGLTVTGDTVVYGYDITEGPFVEIAAVRFRGNTVTTDATARRLAGLVPGQTFSASKSEQAAARLLRSGLFTEARMAELSDTDVPGREDARFEVREPRYNSLFGAMGYNQGAGQKGWLAGAFDLDMRNISGTARQLAFHWERPQKYSSSLRASYREPWLFGWPAGASLAIRHVIQDSLYVQTAGQLLLTVPLGDLITAGAGGSVERTVPGSQLAVRRSLQYSSLWSLHGDHRDVAHGGTGWHYRLQLSYGRKRYYDPSAQLTVSRAETDVQWSVPLVGEHIIDLAAHGRALISSEHPAPLADQYFLGGAGTMRGYFEQQFAASQLAWLNAEYRLAAAAGFELYPFIDCGFLRDHDRGPDRVKAGYGMGMRLDTRLGRIQIDYGLGQGDGPAAGKLHLILRSDF